MKKLLPLFFLVLLCLNLSAQGNQQTDTLLHRNYRSQKGITEKDLKEDIEVFLQNLDYEIESKSPLIISEKEDSFIPKRSVLQRLAFWRKKNSLRYPIYLKHTLKFSEDENGKTNVDVYSFANARIKYIQTSDSLELRRILKKSRSHALELSKSEYKGLKTIIKSKKDN